MTKRRTAIAAASAFVLAAGSAGAIAATSGDDGKKREDAVLTDAAKRLNVTPEKLREALGAAQDAQLDQAVKDGDLTQEQADAIKKRRQASGRVLGIGPGGHHKLGFGRGGFGLRGSIADIGDAVAKALGLSRSELREQLRDGKTFAEIAKAQNKDLDDVKAAAETAITKELDEAVKDGKITDAMRDRMVAHLDEHLDALAEGKFPHPGHRKFGHHLPPPGP